MRDMDEARLYVVATPIGNLEDITLRALDILASVDLIAAEDTRHTRVLLSRHGLKKPMLALQEHNEAHRAPQLVDRLLGGESVALVSDAGTPLLSDPGFRLVSLAAASGIQVVTVPGPSSITAALSISGLPTDRFTFEGFLPSKPAARRNTLEALKSEPRTLVFFESSHRIEESLSDMAQTLGGERAMAVCRELTKQFETVLRGSIAEVTRRIGSDPNQRKGEFVLIVAGSEERGEEKFSEALGLARFLKEYLPASKAARIAAKLHGVSRRDLYSALE
jgi:16S rRNA (cytidine1402-2'-O)-methyltransferase